MSEIKLLPCPFCGGEVQYHSWSHTMENFFNKNTIICPTCDFAMEDVSEIRLIKKWNTRKPIQEIVERLEEECEAYRNSDWLLRDKAIKVGTMNTAMDIVKEAGGIE